MLGKYRRHLVARDRAIIPRRRVGPEEQVQYLIEASFVANHAHPFHVAVELFLRGVTAASFCGSIRPIMREFTAPQFSRDVRFGFQKKLCIKGERTKGLLVSSELQLM